MKRFAALSLSLLLLLFAAACSSDTEENTNPGADMTVDEIMTQLIEGVNSEISTASIPLDEENFKAYTFIDYIEGAEGVVSKAMISSVAHSVVLVRLPEDADVQAVAEDIEANANPNKWLCVTAEKTQVVSHGNLVLLVMSFEDDVDTIVDNFNAFCE